jgi:hypothetical protein
MIDEVEAGRLSPGLASLVLAAVCVWHAPTSHAQARPTQTPSVEGRIASTPATTTLARVHTAREFESHVAQLRRRLPSRLFTVVVEPPFVVIGDGGRAAVEASARDTVKWAVDLLKRDYFTKDPADILDVWLFRDADSYEKNGLALFGRGPDTPYGYYSPAHKALVMNISTGGGTLVHEIVHPFIEANFPGCPAWLNEGLGSLYEQCGERDGHLRGYINWRLPGLQRAVREGRVRSFKTLTAMSAEEFYAKETGVNYAQARYLCYYLQERGLLVRFYHEFLNNRSADPTGFDTLKRVLAFEDADAFQKDWETFVLGLAVEIRTPPPAR